ncbi:centriolin [Planoprotostelium fungivorum]|uniref:Centriolin n=1 Tax=Planoprotostelium fungivorum TaxID=1890364 RepID=A0A2P6N0Z4_9EUKA|nr:centriolin [Planoprotostelium fungivorum]
MGDYHLVLYITEDLIRRTTKAENLKEIKSLNLHPKKDTQHRIKFIENLDSLVSLASLDLSGNHIVKIENLSRLSNLTDLNLSDNRISKIEQLDSLKKLNTLNLSGNKLERFISLPILQKTQQLQNLRILRLARNQISSLNEITSIGALKNLTSLNLEGNPVCSLPHYRLSVIFHLPNLEILDGEAIDVDDRRRARDRFSRDEVVELNEQLQKSKQKQKELQVLSESQQKDFLAAEDRLFELQNQLKTVETSQSRVQEECNVKTKLLEQQAEELSRLREDLYNLKQEQQMSDIDRDLSPIVPHNENKSSIKLRSSKKDESIRLPLEPRKTKQQERISKLEDSVEMLADTSNLIVEELQSMKIQLTELERASEDACNEIVQTERKLSKVLEEIHSLCPSSNEKILRLPEEEKNTNEDLKNLALDEKIKQIGRLRDLIDIGGMAVDRVADQIHQVESELTQVSCEDSQDTKRDRFTESVSSMREGKPNDETMDQLQGEDDRDESSDSSGVLQYLEAEWDRKKELVNEIEGDMKRYHEETQTWERELNHIVSQREETELTGGSAFGLSAFDSDDEEQIEYEQLLEEKEKLIGLMDSVLGLLQTLHDDYHRQHLNIEDIDNQVSIREQKLIENENKRREQSDQLSSLRSIVQEEEAKKRKEEEVKKREQAEFEESKLIVRDQEKKIEEYAEREKETLDLMENLTRENSEAKNENLLLKREREEIEVRVGELEKEAKRTEQLLREEQKRTMDDTERRNQYLARLRVLVRQTNSDARVSDVKDADSAMTCLEASIDTLLDKIQSAEEKEGSQKDLREEVKLHLKRITQLESDLTKKDEEISKIRMLQTQAAEEMGRKKEEKEEELIKLCETAQRQSLINSELNRDGQVLEDRLKGLQELIITEQDTLSSFESKQRERIKAYQEKKRRVVKQMEDACNTAEMESTNRLNELQKKQKAVLEEYHSNLQKAQNVKAEKSTMEEELILLRRRLTEEREKLSKTSEHVQKEKEQMEATIRKLAELDAKYKKQLHEQMSHANEEMSKSKAQTAALTAQKEALLRSVNQLREEINQLIQRQKELNEENTKLERETKGERSTEKNVNNHAEMEQFSAVIEQARRFKQIHGEKIPVLITREEQQNIDDLQRRLTDLTSENHRLSNIITTTSASSPHTPKNTENELEMRRKLTTSSKRHTVDMQNLQKVYLAKEERISRRLLKTMQEMQDRDKEHVMEVQLLSEEVNIAKRAAMGDNKFTSQLQGLLHTFEKLNGELVGKIEESRKMRHEMSSLSHLQDLMKEKEAQIRFLLDQVKALKESRDQSEKNLAFERLKSELYTPPPTIDTTWGVSPVQPSHKSASPDVLKSSMNDQLDRLNDVMRSREGKNKTAESLTMEERRGGSFTSSPELERLSQEKRRANRQVDALASQLVQSQTVLDNYRKTTEDLQRQVEMRDREFKQLKDQLNQVHRTARRTSEERTQSPDEPRLFDKARDFLESGSRSWMETPSPKEKKKASDLYW